MDSASQATIGDADPSGFTNPGELHLTIAAPGAASSGGFGDGANWWWLIVAAVAALLILKR
jgi:hypothetical protein